MLFTISTTLHSEESLTRATIKDTLPSKSGPLLKREKSPLADYAAGGLFARQAICKEIADTKTFLTNDSD